MLGSGRGVNLLLPLTLAAFAGFSASRAAEITLEAGFRTPPLEARPHTYWLWMNGHVDLPSAQAELQAMKDAGLSGVLLFEMGARGDKATFPPPGPPFLSDAWVANLKRVLEETRGPAAIDWSSTVVAGEAAGEAAGDDLDDHDDWSDDEE